MQAVYPRPLGPFVLLAPLGHAEGETVSLAMTGPLFDERLVRLGHGPVSPAEPEEAALARLRELEKVSHPGLLGFRGCGLADGELFVAFEHLVGRSLAELVQLAKGEGLPIPRSVAFFVAREVVAALAYLHAGGAAGSGRPLVHGAADAAHVLISFDGEVKLVPGSFARLRHETSAPSTPSLPEGDLRADLRAWAAMLHELLGNCPPPPPEDSNLAELWAVLSAEERALPAAAVWKELLDRVLSSQPAAQGELAALMLLFPDDREREARLRLVEEGRPLSTASDSPREPGTHGAHSSPTVQIRISSGAIEASGSEPGEARSGEARSGEATRPVATTLVGRSALAAEVAAPASAADETGAVPLPLPPRRTPWSMDTVVASRVSQRSPREEPAFAAGELAFFAAHQSGVVTGAGPGEAAAAGFNEERPSRAPRDVAGEVGTRPSARRTTSRRTTSRVSGARRASEGSSKKRTRIWAAWLGVMAAGALSFALIWWLQPLRRGAESPSAPTAGPPATAIVVPTDPVVAGPPPASPVETGAVTAPAEPGPAAEAESTALAARGVTGADEARAAAPQARKQLPSPSLRAGRSAATSLAAPVGRGAELESVAAVLSRARFAYVNEDFEDAISGARQALTMGAGAEAHALLGNAYLGKRAYRDAEREYVRALALDPMDMHSKDRLEWLRARRQGLAGGAPSSGTLERASLRTGRSPVP